MDVRVIAVKAGEAIGMVSHVGADIALGALVFQTADLAGRLNVVVLEESEGSLSVLVLYLLGLGVDLLLSLTLATVKGDVHVDGALSHKAGLLEGHAVLKRGSAEGESVDSKFNSLLNLRSQVRDKVASLNIDRELLASWAVHENLHFQVRYVVSSR